MDSRGCEEWLVDFAVASPRELLDELHVTGHFEGRQAFLAVVDDGLGVEARAGFLDDKSLDGILFSSGGLIRC